MRLSVLNGFLRKRLGLVLVVVTPKPGSNAPTELKIDLAMHHPTTVVVSAREHSYLESVFHHASTVAASWRVGSDGRFWVDPACTIGFVLAIEGLTKLREENGPNR